MSQRAKVIIAMLTLYVVWGTTYLAIKVGIDAGLPPALFAGLRLVPAAAIMFGLARLRGASLRGRSRDLRIVSIVGLLLLVGGQYWMMVAEQYVPSGIAALVVALDPAVDRACRVGLPRHAAPEPTRLAGARGRLLRPRDLLWPRLAGVRDGPRRAPRHRHRRSSARGCGRAAPSTASAILSSVDAMVVTAYEMLDRRRRHAASSAPCSANGESSLSTPKALGALVYLIVFGSCIAFTAFVYALAHLPASKVMTYAYVNPVIAVFAGGLPGRSVSSRPSR